MSNEILPLSDKYLQMLSLKHPEAQQAHYEEMLQGPKRQIRSEDINEDLVKKATIKTKGGPSGLDADNWRRILVSNQFGSSPSKYCERFMQCKHILFKFRYWQ